MRNFLLVGFGLIFAFAFQDSASGEAPEKQVPIYEGKPLSHWIAALKEKRQVTRHRAVQTLGAIGKPAVPALIEALKDKDPWIRGGAIGALLSIGPSAEAAVPALIRVLAEDSDPLRRAAALALGQIGPGAQEAVPELVKAMRGGKLLLSQYAAVALGKIGPGAKAAVPALREALKGSDPSLAADAAGALWRIDRHNRDAIPTLIGILEKSKDSTPRATAASVLGQIGPPPRLLFPPSHEHSKIPPRTSAYWRPKRSGWWTSPITSPS
jgi:HEAT repeat protein